MFAPVGDGQRRRRGSDGVRLAGAVLALVCCVLVIRYDSRIDRAIVQVIHPPPRSITWLVTVVYQAGSFGVVIVLVALALIARRWAIARDIALSAAGAAAVSGILVVLLGSRGGRPSGIVIDGYYLSFPVLRIALFMAVATAALPYLARGVQRLIEIFIALVALASAVGGHGLPLNVLGSLAIGWGVTAAVRLVFGSPLGLPSTDDVRLLLEELGIRSSDVHAVTRQVWGVAKYEATETAGAGSPGQRSASRSTAGMRPTPGCSPRRAGSCCTGTPGRASRLPGFSRSNTRPTSPCGPARRAWPCPSSSRQERRDRPRTRCSSAACRPGPRWPRPDAADVSDATLDDLYRQLLTLRRARIAHGAISGDALLVDPAAQTTVLTDFRNATSSASPDQLDRDLAGAMAATAVAVGAERAADAAARCLTPEMLEGALRHLHKPALDPALGRSLRGKRELLEDVRQRAAQASLDRGAEAGRAAPGELADADHGHRHAHRRLGPDRGAHRRLQVLRHRDRGRLALGHHGVRPGPAGLRGVGRRGHRQRGRAASVRPGGGGRGRQGLQRAGRRDRGRLRHPGALLPAAGLRRHRWR